MRLHQLHIYMTYTQSHNLIVALTQGPAPVVLLTAPGVGEKSFRLAGEGCKQILKGSEGYLFRKRSEESQKERERESQQKRTKQSQRDGQNERERQSQRDRKPKKESIRQKIERLRKKQIQKKRKTGIRKKKKEKDRQKKDEVCQKARKIVRKKQIESKIKQRERKRERERWRVIGVVFLKPNFEVMTSGQYEVRQKRVLEMHQCRQQIYLVSPPTALSN